jgi:phosphoribosyl 1,2-cyclic phosphodiesterase
MRPREGLAFTIDRGHRTIARFGKVFRPGARLDLTVSVRSFGSGSSGNALLIEAGASAVLIDAGVGPRSLKSGLALAGREPDQLTAVLLTHEHVDHVRSVGWFTRRNVPIVATAGTASATGLNPSAYTRVVPGKQLALDGLIIHSLSVSHDALEPCGYLIETSEMRITVVTDIGCANDELVEPLQTSNLIVLEANHDETMLRRGPYPAHLKRRVLSDHGHLSNADCAELLARSLGGRGTPSTIWLAHLSQTNNTPAVALKSVKTILADIVGPYKLMAMPRHGCDLEWRSDAAFHADPLDFQLQLPLF